MEDWYADWQNLEHPKHFDFRSTLDSPNLVRNYESFNDVRLLNERLDSGRDLVLLEVGCGTGEFYRYLRIRYPKVRYVGADISKPALERAREKYPEARFFLTAPDVKVQCLPEMMSLGRLPEIVYAKDVVHHQTRPFEFVRDLIECALEATIFRCRTRDVGKTELDPEVSCQYHYSGWMPYIVMNLEELINSIRSDASAAEIVVYRNHVVLGGQHNRYLPKDCYLKETGTAETAVGVFKRMDHPGRVSIEDRGDQNPHYTLGHKIKRALRRARRMLPRPLI